MFRPAAARWFGQRTAALNHSMSIKRSRQLTLDGFLRQSKKVKDEDEDASEKRTRRDDMEEKRAAEPRAEPAAESEILKQASTIMSPPKSSSGSSTGDFKSGGSFQSDIPFSELCETFQSIEETSSRLAITAICSSFLYSVLKRDPQSLIPITYLFIHRLGPDYEPGLELGLGESLLIKTISEACGLSLIHI